jgi:hypothetical protein
MNKPTKLPTVADALEEMDRNHNVHLRLSLARQKFHTLKLKKSGKNTFAGYEYFELGDFLLPALQVFAEFGIGATISFDRDLATMTIRNLDNPEDTITLTSPMGSAALKGCHEVQNIGAVETYQRRYLWVAALEIVEHDALEPTTGSSRVEPHITTGEEERPPAFGPRLSGDMSDTQLKGAVKAIVHHLNGVSSLDELDDYLSDKDALSAIEQCKRRAPHWWETGKGMPAEFRPLKKIIAETRNGFLALEQENA